MKNLKEKIRKVLEKHSHDIGDSTNGICWPEEDEDLVKDLAKLLKNKI